MNKVVFLHSSISLYEKPLLGLTTNNKYFMLLDDWQLQLTYWQQEKEGYDEVTGIIVEHNCLD